MGSLLRVITMGSSEKYSLKWKGFTSNILNSFQSIRHEENLSDVTLICGDEFINAHKLVLAASSDFFQNIFRKCQKTNPLIILKSTTAMSQISSLLDFLYNGEVKIDPENLQGFLEVGNELKIKGLADHEPDSKSEKNVYAPYSNSSSQLLQSHTMSLLQSSDIQSFPSYEEICKVSLGMEYTEPLTNDTVFEVSSNLGSNEYQSLRGEKEEDVEQSHSPGTPFLFANSGFGLWKCKRCGKEDKSRSVIKEHVKAHLGNNHIYFCSVCGKSYKTKNALRVHKY